MADQLGEQNQNSGLVLHAYRGLGQKELYDHLGSMKNVETIPCAACGSREVAPGE